MAIIRGDSGVTVTGSESGTGNQGYVQIAPKTSPAPTPSGPSPSDSDSGSHGTLRDQQRLETIRQIASYDPSYKQTLGYQETSAELEKSTGTVKTFGEYSPGTTPWEQLLSRSGPVYESREAGLKAVKMASTYAPEQTEAAFSSSPKEFPAAFASATAAGQQRQAVEEQRIRQVPGLLSVQRDEYGLVSSITVRDGGKFVEYNPGTGEVYSIRDEAATVDFRTGRATYNTTGVEISPYKESDLLVLKKMGVTPEISPQNLGYTDWYWKDVEQQAQERGARALALSVVEGIAGASSATGQLASMEETDEGYIVRLTDSAKNTNATLLMDNAIAGYSKVDTYAQASKIGLGEYLIRQKPVTDPKYWLSKGFGTDTVSGIGLSSESKEPTITLVSGKTEKYSELTPAQKTAFNLNYSSTLDEMAANVNATALKAGYGIAGGGARFENTDGNVTLDTSGIFSLESWHLNAVAALASSPQAQQSVSFEFKNAGGTYQLYKAGTTTYGFPLNLPRFTPQEVPYSQLSASEKGLADQAVAQMKAAPEYAAGIVTAEKVLGAGQVGIQKTATGYEFKNVEAYNYISASQEAYNKTISDYQEKAAKYPGERDIFADLGKLGQQAYDFTVHGRWLSEVPAQEAKQYEVKPGTYFENEVKWGQGQVLPILAGKAGLITAQAEHELSKGIHSVFGEQAQLPFGLVQPLSTAQAKAVDYKLSLESQALEAQATAGWREFRYYEEAHDPFAFEKSPLASGGAIVLPLAIGGAIALPELLGGIALPFTVGRIVSQTAVAGSAVLLMGQGGKTVREPGYRPFANIEDVKKMAAAAYASAAVYSVASPLLSSGLGFFSKEVAATVEKGAELRGAAGLSVSASSMALAGGAYSATEALYENRPVKGEDVIAGAESGAVWGGLFFAGGAMARPVVRFVGGALMEARPTEITLRPSEEIVRTSDIRGVTAEIRGAGEIKTAFGKVPIESIQGEAAFYQAGDFGTAYTGDIVASISGKTLKYQIAGALKEVPNAREFDLKAPKPLDMASFTGQFTAGKAAGRLSGYFLKEYETGMNPGASFVMPEKGAAFKQIEFQGMEQEYVLQPKASIYEPIIQRHMVESAAQTSPALPVTENIGKAFATAYDIPYMEAINQPMVSIERIPFGYRAVLPEYPEYEGFVSDVKTTSLGRMYLTEPTNLATKPGTLIIGEGPGAGLYKRWMESPRFSESGPEFLVQERPIERPAMRSFVQETKIPTKSVPRKVKSIRWKSGAQLRRAGQHVIGGAELLEETDYLTIPAEHKIPEAALMSPELGSAGKAVAMSRLEARLAELPTRFVGFNQRAGVGSGQRSNVLQSMQMRSKLNLPAARQAGYAFERQMPNQLARTLGWSVERPLERQIERQFGRQMERQLERQVERQMERQLERQVERQMERQLERQPEFTFQFASPQGGISLPRRPRELRPVSLHMHSQRIIYADLYSVAKSQLRYGQATHPSVIRRPEVWQYEGRGIGKVPTVEIMEHGGPKGGLLMRQSSRATRRKWI